MLRTSAENMRAERGRKGLPKMSRRRSEPLDGCFLFAITFWTIQDVPLETWV